MNNHRLARALKDAGIALTGGRFSRKLNGRVRSRCESNNSSRAVAAFSYGHILSAPALSQRTWTSPDESVRRNLNDAQTLLAPRQTVTARRVCLGAKRVTICGADASEMRTRQGQFDRLRGIFGARTGTRQRCCSRSHAEPAKICRPAARLDR